LFRPYRPGDEDEINRLFNEIFHLKRSIDEWRWRFNPEHAGCAILVAEHRQTHEIYAHYGVITCLAQVAGRTIRVGQPVDTYCRRDELAVAQRVMPKLILHFYRTFCSTDGLPMLYGFPSNRVLKLGKMKMSYGEPTPVQSWQFPVARRRWLFPSWLDSEPLSAGSVSTLWNRVAHRYPTSNIRDEQWVRNRFMDRPRNRYLHFLVQQDDIPVVWAVFVPDGKKLLWIDCLWDGESVDAMKDVMERALTHARRGGARVIEFWLNHDEALADVLRSEGWQFSPDRENLHLATVGFDDSLDSTQYRENLYITMADTDLV